MDSQDGLNYLGSIIACCSMRIVSRTGGVVVFTLSLHAEGPWFKSGQVVLINLEQWLDLSLGMKLTSVVCKLEIKINLSKSKVKVHPVGVNFSLLQIHIHHQMCNLELIQNQYAPRNVESRPYPKSICTTCQDLNQGPSACKLSVQTTTPQVLDSP